MTEITVDLTPSQIALIDGLMPLYGQTRDEVVFHGMIEFLSSHYSVEEAREIVKKTEAST